MPEQKKIPKWFLIPLVFLLFFINKPFHIDDTLFLNIGRILPWTLIGSSYGDISFLGKVYENLSPYESTHPPLIPYFLKLIGLGSEGEFAPFWLYHFFFLFFPFLTLLEGWKLSIRKKISPLWVWFLVLSPLFFVNATNLMTDIAMLCFWLGSITSMITYIEDGGRKNALKAIAFLTAAFFTSYQSVSLIPLLVLYILVYGDRKRKSLLVLLLPSLFFFVYLLVVFAISGFFPFLASSINYNIGSEVISGMKMSAYLHKIIAVLVFSGLGLLFPTPLLLASLNRRRFLEYVVFASIVSFTFFHLGRSFHMFDGYSFWERIVLRFLMLLGAIWLFFLLAKLIDGLRILTRSPRRASNYLLLTFWFFGVIAFNIIFLPYATARYLLPAVPAAIILLFIRPRFKVNSVLMNMLIAGLACLSLLMAAVDYRQASSDWSLFKKVRIQVPDLKRLWFSDDAGLAVYLGNSGAKYIPEDRDQLPEGDYVLLTRGLISEKLQQTLSPMETFRFQGLAGLSLFNTKAHAGFYRSMDGFLPMAFTNEVRRAVLLKVNHFLKGFDTVERIQLSAPNYADIRGFYDEGNQMVRGIHMHPDAEIAFPVRFESTMVMTGQVFIPKESWEKEGDGTSFHLGFRRQGQTEWVWERWVDPKPQVADRERIAFEVVVPSDVEAIHLKVGPGPQGDYRNDSAFWLSMELRETANLD